MPKLATLTKDDFETHRIPGSGFGWSCIKSEHLKASKYALCHLIFDNSGSVFGFQKQIQKAVEESLKGIQRGAAKHNVLVRCLSFGMAFKELNPFNLVALVDVNDIVKQLTCDEAGTRCYDTVLHSIEATKAFAEDLRKQDYTVNMITIVITDGCDNMSKAKSGLSIKDEMEKLRSLELLESTKMILVKVNVDDPDVSKELDKFAEDAGFDQTEDVKLVHDKHIARLVGFISKSVTSTGQAIGTGSPSQLTNLGPDPDLTF